MIIIYHCYGGTHSSVVAAGIHLGILPNKHTLEPEQLKNLSLFDSHKKVIPGKLHHFGTDEMNNNIYSCGLQNSAGLVINTSTELLDTLGYNQSDLKFVDTLGCVNLFMRVGGYLSQRLNLKSIGKPIVIKGTLKAYPDLIRLVTQVKNDLNK